MASTKADGAQSLMNKEIIMGEEGYRGGGGGGAGGGYAAYAVEWLQNFGKIVPDSVQLLGYNSLVTHAITLDHAENGRVLCSLRVPPRLCNTGDRMHGGAIFSLVEIIGTAAILSTGTTYTGESIEINVTFMSEAPMSEEIEIEGKALRVGKNLAVVSVDLRRKLTGQLVAQGRQTKVLTPSKTTISSKL